MTFKFDEDATLDSMAHASSVDLDLGQVTLFAVVCIGSDEAHFSHGGQLTLSAEDAIGAARAANAAESWCRYLPAAVGIPVPQLLQLAMLVTGQASLQEPDDVG